jgi:hypothetical protein
MHTINYFFSLIEADVLSEKIEDFEGSAYIVLDLRMEKLILMQGLMEASHYIKLQRMV